MTIKERLLQLSNAEKAERKKALNDFMFYHGGCEDEQAAVTNPDLLGQNWITLDDIDYVPSQIIDNKVKPLLNKQARFMFSRKPRISLKAYDKSNDEQAHELNQYLDSIFSDNDFWSETMKAFRLATITKRVLLRMEANPGQPVKLYWHGINDFSYELDPNDARKLAKVIIVKQDSDTITLVEEEQLWFKYIYYMENDRCYLTTEVYKGNDTNNPIEVNNNCTKLTRIPCWVVFNEHGMGSKYGQSDLKDLRPLQDQYNKKLSDFSDALRFNMFGQDVFVDATAESVEAVKVAPNSIIALVSLDDKKADYKKVENTFSNAEPVKMYLQLLEDSMYDKLAIPKPNEIKSVLSGKAYKFMFSELVARCDEKWIDWEPIIRQLIQLIIEACDKFKCYPDWNEFWGTLDYNLVINKNYPIPEDVEDKKRLGMEEVATNVRSRRSYIKEFTDDENYEDKFNEICEDLSKITAAENEQFNTI